MSLSKYSDYKVEARPEFLDTGSHVLAFKSCRDGISKKGSEYYAFTFTVVESDNPLHPAGSEVVRWITKGKFLDYFLQDIFKVVSAVLNVTLGSVKIDTCDELAENQEIIDLVVGRKVKALVTPKEGKNGAVYKNYTFLPLDPPIAL